MRFESIKDFADRQGAKRRVIHAPGALESWDEASKRMPAGKAIQVEGFLIALFEDWIDGARLHPGWATTEGELDKSTKFYAIKRVPIRGYFWYSKVNRNTIVISHYVYKKWQKLRPKDIKRVKANWKAESR